MKAILPIRSRSHAFFTATAAVLIAVLGLSGCGPKKVKAEDLWQLKERVQILELELQRRDREIASIKEALLVLEMSGPAGSAAMIDNPPAPIVPKRADKGEATRPTEVTRVEPIKPVAKEPVAKPKTAPNLQPTTLNIQAALKKAGFYTGLVDGKSGPKTREAVKAFQRSQKLTPDGAVGPKTWSKLSRFLIGQPELSPEN